MKQEAERLNDCWNRIGVWAHSVTRCDRLREVVHCRNCEVFVSAGKQIFERPLPPGYRQENLASLASTEAVGQQDSVSIIVFRLGSELFSLPASVFETVTESRPVHRLPHVNNPFVKGVANIAGEVCLCHSLMTVLGVNPEDHGASVEARHIYKRLIVVNLDGGRYVFPVDEVKGMARYQPAQLKPPPATIEDDIRQLIRGTFRHQGDRVAVLDVERLHRLLHGGSL